MVKHTHNKLVSGTFITFSGNCKKALTFYQACFGGTLKFETFKLKAYAETPVVSGSIFSDGIIIHGSDLVHDEGRKIGNYMAVFLLCKNAHERKTIIEKLESGKKSSFAPNNYDQKLIEVTDAFDVRWVLGINDNNDG